MHHAARPPLARIMSIDQAVRAGTWPNARTLAERLEVDPRTVRRDITYMRDQLGAPLEYVASYNGYRYSELTFRLPYLSVTEGELVGLLLAQRLLGQFRGTPSRETFRPRFPNSPPCSQMRSRYIRRPPPIALPCFPSCGRNTTLPCLRLSPERSWVISKSR